MALENWSREDLISEVRRLNRKVEELEKENREQYIENSHLNFRIDNELEPRIRSERRAYDNWVTNPERGR